MNAAPTFEALSIVEAARLASVGRSTVYAEIGAGRLRARKVRGRTIILKADFLDWLHSTPVAA